MAAQPSRALLLYGTEQVVTPPKLLRAGPLSAQFAGGNLRDIRYHGVEVMRAISFILRDRDWGTYEPQISDLQLDEGAEHFRLSYRARAADPEQAFHFEAQIEGHADGRLVFRAKGRAESDFCTNRTGFVILHPLAGVAGERAEVEHVDGRVVQTVFPARIDPVQPMMDLRRLSHWAAGGALRVDCRMEGDTYEMEDQRNWTDASYKTYVRPLALPWPYVIAKGEGVEQSISLTISGDYAAQSSTGLVTVALGAPLPQAMSPLGAGLEPEDLTAVETYHSDLRALGLNHLICHYDPRKGHDRESLARQVAVAQALGAEAWLEVVVISVEDYEAELRALAHQVDAMGRPFARVMVSPAPDLKCTLPGSIWPPAPPADALYALARRLFQDALIGGGMMSYFTELNRKRPPLAHLDYVSFTTSAEVHAGDDRSVMESLEALPAIALSAGAIAGERPWSVGPSAMGMRDNPYGAAPKENPDNIRQAMNRADPRQRGLFGAAWSLGYIARMAYGGASEIALGGLCGDFGVISEQGQPYPVAFVMAAMAQGGGQGLRGLTISQPEQLQGIALGNELWLANLSAEPLEVALPSGLRQLARLEVADLPSKGRLEGGALGPLDQWQPLAGAQVVIDSYGIIRLRA